LEPSSDFAVTAQENKLFRTLLEVAQKLNRFRRPDGGLQIEIKHKFKFAARDRPAFQLVDVDAEEEILDMTE
jgi:hypothetical protein